MRNTIVGIAGRRGSGKSTVMVELLKRCPRLFVFDPMGEHTWIPNQFQSLDDAERFLAWGQTQKTFAGSYIPDSDLSDELQQVAGMVYEFGNLVLGVEEIPMVCSPSSLPYELDRIVRLGRHQAVSLAWTAQRMAEVARRLTAATDYFVLFSHTEPRDLDGIAERCGQSVARRVAELDRHGRLVWDAVGAHKLDSLEAVAGSIAGCREYDEPMTR